MSSDEWDDDVALLSDLGRALEQDADVPESVRDAGRGSDRTLGARRRHRPVSLVKVSCWTLMYPAAKPAREYSR